MVKSVTKKAKVTPKGTTALARYIKKTHPGIVTKKCVGKTTALSRRRRVILTDDQDDHSPPPSPPPSPNRRDSRTYVEVARTPERQGLKGLNGRASEHKQAPEQSTGAGRNDGRVVLRPHQDASDDDEVGRLAGRRVGPRTGNRNGTGNRNEGNSGRNHDVDRANTLDQTPAPSAGRNRTGRSRTERPWRRDTGDAGDAGEGNSLDPFNQEDMYTEDKTIEDKTIAGSTTRLAPLAGNRTQRPWTNASAGEGKVVHGKTDQVDINVQTTAQSVSRTKGPRTDASASGADRLADVDIEGQSTPQSVSRTERSVSRTERRPFDASALGGNRLHYSNQGDTESQTTAQLAESRKEGRSGNRLEEGHPSSQDFGHIDPPTRRLSDSAGRSGANARGRVRGRSRHRDQLIDYHQHIDPPTRRLSGSAGRSGANAGDRSRQRDQLGEGWTQDTGQHIDPPTRRLSGSAGARGPSGANTLQSFEEGPPTNPPSVFRHPLLVTPRAMAGASADTRGDALMDPSGDDKMWDRTIVGICTILKNLCTRTDLIPTLSDKILNLATALVSLWDAEALSTMGTETASRGIEGVMNESQCSIEISYCAIKLFERVDRAFWAGQKINLNLLSASAVTLLGHAQRLGAGLWPLRLTDGTGNSKSMTTAKTRMTRKTPKPRGNTEHPGDDSSRSSSSECTQLDQTHKPRRPRQRVDGHASREEMRNERRRRYSVDGTTISNVTISSHGNKDILCDQKGKIEALSESYLVKYLSEFFQPFAEGNRKEKTNIITDIMDKIEDPEGGLRFLFGCDTEVIWEMEDTALRKKMLKWMKSRVARYYDGGAERDDVTQDDEPVRRETRFSYNGEQRGLPLRRHSSVDTTNRESMDLEEPPAATYAAKETTTVAYGVKETTPITSQRPILRRYHSDDTASRESMETKKSANNEVSTGKRMAVSFVSESQDNSGAGKFSRTTGRNQEKKNYKELDSDDSDDADE